MVNHAREHGRGKLSRLGVPFIESVYLPLVEAQIHLEESSQTLMCTTRRVSIVY